MLSICATLWSVGCTFECTATSAPTSHAEPCVTMGGMRQKSHCAGLVGNETVSITQKSWPGCLDNGDTFALIPLSAAHLGEREPQLRRAAKMFRRQDGGGFS